jgi:choline dehydrogenase-like flavoprotein
LRCGNDDNDSGNTKNVLAKVRKFDALIVGSGAAGSAVAWRLASRGLSVAVVEQGDWFTGADLSSEGWELHGHRSLSPVPSVRNGPLDFRVDSSDSDIEVSNFQGVGGSTNIYSGHFPRFRPEDFSRKTTLGLAADWPFPYTDLLPYYEINEIRMKVSGRIGDSHFPEIKSLGPEVPVGESGNRLYSAFREKGWHCWVSYGAFDTQTHSKTRCTNLGPCNLGCPTDSKMTAVNGYLSDAIEMGVSVFPKSAVSEVEIQGGVAKIVSIRRPDGSEFSLKADVFVLAAGSLGTPKVLLTSHSFQKQGLANSSGLLGQNLMVHPLGFAEGGFENLVDSNNGPRGSWMYSLEFGDFVSPDQPGFMLQMLRGSDLVNLGRRVFRSSRNKEEFNLDGALAGVDSTIGIAVVVEDLPVSSNRVVLDSKVKDNFGLPGLKVSYKVTEASKSAIGRGLNASRQIFSQMGAKYTVGMGPVRGAGWHPSGTARMGEDPSKSVTNHLGVTHDVPNIVIADASLFPTGSCLNPTNTIQALALRVADGILNDN